MEVAERSEVEEISILNFNDKCVKLFLRGDFECLNLSKNFSNLEKN